MERRGSWLKINKKLVLDYMKGTEKDRSELLKYILGRLILGSKHKQYLCVSNDSSMFLKSGEVIMPLFDIIALTPKLWPYKIPLSKLAKIYSVFFKEIPLKIKLYL